MELLEGDPSSRPTAFVCYNEELAVILLEAIRQQRLRIPEDISVVGFDDSFLATATEVKLTTVAHPKSELGVKAAETLLEMIGNPSGARAKDYVFEPQLILRESNETIRSVLIDRKKKHGESRVFLRA